MKSIKILGLTYDIERVPFVSRDECRLGEIDFIGQKIRILDSLSDDKARETLLHEVVHGIFQGLGFAEEVEKETMTQALAAAFYHCLRSNADVFQGFFV